MTRHGMAMIGLRASVAVGVSVGAFLARDPSAVVGPTLLVFALCLIWYRLDLTNIWVVFTVPWMMILGYSVLQISEYSRAVSPETIRAIVVVLAIGLLLLPSERLQPPPHRPPSWPVNDRVFKIILAGYIAFCALNVALAGYVPLVQLATTGDSGYMDFGVKGLYGLFNAFANAFGLTAFYLWMTHRGRRLYMWSFFLVLSVFLLFMTRQNMMSLMVEAFLVYNVVVRRISGWRVILMALGVLFAFAALGDFRVDADIVQIAAIRDEYLWVPRAFIWLYTYCYFNILNLDNVVAASSPPAYDGSSLMALLPSFLRPELDEGDSLLEVSSFTVNSFISPIFHDIGMLGLCLTFGTLCLAVGFYLRRRRNGDFFLGDTGYAVLYFCFLFSFFVNFWFYLPVIFQLVFLPIFKRILFIRNGRR